MNHLLNYILTSHFVILRTCVLNFGVDRNRQLIRILQDFSRSYYTFSAVPPRFSTSLCSFVQELLSCRGILVDVVRRSRKTRQRPVFYTVLARGAKRPLLEHVAQGQLWRQRNTRSYTRIRARTNAHSLARLHARSYGEPATFDSLGPIPSFCSETILSLRRRFIRSI